MNKKRGEFEKEYRRNGLLYGVVLILLIILVNVVSFDEIRFAPEGITYESNSIQRIYSAGQEIRGNVNLTLDGVNSEVVLSSNFGGNVTLLELIERSDHIEGVDYECSTSNCEKDYSRGQQINSLGVSSDRKIAGFSISGQGVSTIQAVKLGIGSDIGRTCAGQLFIDVLNDENYIINTKATTQACAAVYEGCFDVEESTDAVIISTGSRYCEKITLPAAPDFHLRANVKNSTSGNRELKMMLYDEEGSQLFGQCILPQHTENDYQNRGCVVNYTSALQKEYFVCIAPGTGNTNADYKIKYETSQAHQRCGTNNFQTFDVDYEISALAMESDFVNNLQIDSAYQRINGEEIRILIENYIDAKYGGNCENGCSIPFEFFGGQQTLAFSNPQLRYTANQGTAESNNFYEMELEPASISSEYLELDLGEANFIIPLDTNENSFKLYANNELVFEQAINVSPSFDFSVSPRFVAFGQNALFVANASGNIISSRWDFGDGSPAETVNAKQISHRYLEQGEFDLEVTLVKSGGVNSTRTFEIIVGDAKEIANRTIDNYEIRIINLTAKIDSYEEWLRDELKLELDVQLMDSSLKQIKMDYNAASTDDEYQEVMSKLIQLNVPFDIDSSVKGEAPLIGGFENIDPSYIESISGSSEREDLAQAIAGWMSQNIDAEVEYDKIAALRDDRDDVLISRFKISISPKKDIGESYLIIGNDINAIGKFKTSYGEKYPAGEGFTYIPISGQNQIIELYVVGEFEPEELGAYVSPLISNLGGSEQIMCTIDDVCDEAAGENSDNCIDCKEFRFGLFSILIVILIIIALVVYILLQEWYKLNYETHLFKNGNDLYNIINFIYNARKSSLHDWEIRHKLSGMHWTGEQITYAFNKIDGKRTGMYEIPIFKGRENKKVVQEIQKRQKSIIDTRFIKRRGFQ